MTALNVALLLVESMIRPLSPSKVAVSIQQISKSPAKKGSK